MNKEKSEFGLGNIFPTQKQLMDHLSEYGMLTDEQVIKKSSNVNGIDVQAAMKIFLERDLCKGAIDNIIDSLKKLNNDE